MAIYSNLKIKLAGKKSMKFKGGTQVTSIWSDSFPIEKLQVQIFSKKVNISKNNQPTKNDEGAGCIYTLVLHFVLSKQSCKSSNKKKIFWWKFFKS